MLSCLLGGITGCVPWDHTGIALVALSCASLLVLNASVPVFTAVVGVTSFLALLAYDAIDGVGAALLGGPLSGILARLSEAPLLAWAEWESNRVTGGAACGAAIGLLAGALLSRAVSGVRARLADLEEGSDAFRAWTSKPWVRVLAWLLLGGLPKDGFRAALELKGRWWRPLGVAGAASLLVAGSIYLSLAQAKGVRAALVGSLAQLTGAEVNCAGAKLSFATAQLSVTGLAVADPEDLSRDLVRWDSIEADLDALALARHELVIERLVLTGAAFDQPREEVAVRIELPPLEVGDGSKPSRGKEIDWRELIEDKEELERTLEQLRRGFELLSGGGADPDAERRAQELAGVLLPPPSAKTPLKRSRPRVHIIEAAWREIPLSETRTAELVLRDLSDEPDLIEGQPTTTLRTSDGALELSWSRESAQSWRFSGGGAEIDAVQLAEDLDLGDKLLGGTLDVEVAGLISSPGSKLAGELRFQVNGGRAEVGGGPVSLPADAVTLRLEGQLDDPQLLDRDGAWKRWLGSAVSGAILEKATGGGLGELLRGLKKD